MARVVFAPDSFKGSIPAADAARALAAGWREVRPADDVVLRPMADGGEGTLAAFEAAVPGAERMPVRVLGADGRSRDAQWLLLPDGTGVVELASTSGIEMLGGARRPWDADTTGFGQAIAAALDQGVRRLLLGIGSSASTDAGLGLLRALGATVTDVAGIEVSSGARGVAQTVRVDLAHLRPLPAGGVIVLSDVTNPLTGARGAAAVFGPQKGLSARDAAVVDAALGRFAALFPGVDADAPGAGAAGGAGFGLLAWGATLAPGAAAVGQAIGLDDAVADAAVVVTGEGAFDVQSAAGKAPAFVAGVAREHCVPVLLAAGRIAPDADVSSCAATVSLTELAGSADAALADPAEWLHQAGSALARAQARAQDPSASETTARPSAWTSARCSALTSDSA